MTRHADSRLWFVASLVIAVAGLPPLLAVTLYPFFYGHGFVAPLRFLLDALGGRSVTATLAALFLAGAYALAIKGFLAARREARSPDHCSP